MHKEIREQNIQRIEPFLKRLEREIMVDAIPLETVFSHSVEPVPFEERLHGEYAKVEQGDCWGDAWDSAWFNMKATVPRDWNGAAIAARIELNGEALIFDESGCPIYGLSGGSVFIPGYTKEIYLISESCAGGESIDLWIEAVQ